MAEGNAPFVDCGGLTVHQIAMMTRGKKGSTVRLQVIPAADPTKPEEISLVRAELNVDAAADAKETALESKIADALRKQLQEQMKKKVDDVVQATGLDDAGRKALEAAAAKAVDQSVETSKTGVADVLEVQMKSAGLASIGVFEQMEANVDSVVTWAQAEVGVWPTDQPAWTDALKQTLTPAQAAAWKSEEAKQTAAAEAEIADYLKALVSFASDQSRQIIDQRIAQIQIALNLPKDRLDKLNDFEKSLLTQLGQTGRARAEKALLAMDEDKRTAAAGSQDFFPWFGPDTTWKDALEKQLTPDELNRMRTAQEESKARRQQAMGDIMLAVLDEKIAFTDAQRRQLEPICRALVKDQPDLTKDQELNDFNSYSESEFFAAAAAAPEDAIKAILDPVQWQRWQRLANSKPAPDGEEQQEQQIPAPDDPANAPPPPEPDEVERDLSAFMDKLSHGQEEQTLDLNLLKAEDIVRVVRLPPEKAELLETAARGATEHSLDSWKVNIEQNVRSNLGDVTPDTIKARLASIQSYQFGQGSQGDPGQDPVWVKTFNSVLSADQQAAWHKETDARAAYRQQAIAGLVVSAFDERTGISADQWAKLEPMVLKLLKDYGDDFGSFYESYPPSPWYLQTFTMFLPIIGVPQKDMKAVLTRDQWDRWSSSMVFAQGNSNWQNVQQMHQQRAANTAPRL